MRTQWRCTRTSAGEPWDVAAEALADAQLARAAQAAEAGHRVTAADAQAMAIANLLFAQMAFNHDVPRKRALYARLVDASHGLARWSDKRIERVEVPFGDAHLIGWLVRPPTDRVRGTVVLFGGQSGWGFAYWPIARALAARGVATLLAEGLARRDAARTADLRRRRHARRVPAFRRCGHRPCPGRSVSGETASAGRQPRPPRATNGSPPAA